MKLEYSIIYSSKTGNTKILAEKIYNILPKEQCTYYGNIADIDKTLSNILYIGFWTEKGTADLQTLTFLKKLKNKKIFLFGTAGFGESEKYFQNIMNNIKKNIDSSNTIIGTFMCQGKMPISVRKRYEKQKQELSRANIDNLIENFDKALSQTNQLDLEKLENMIQNNYPKI